MLKRCKFEPRLHIFVICLSKISEVHWFLLLIIIWIVKNKLSRISFIIYDNRFRPSLPGIDLYTTSYWLPKLRFRILVIILWVPYVWKSTWREIKAIFVYTYYLCKSYMTCSNQIATFGTYVFFIYYNYFIEGQKWKK